MASVTDDDVPDADIIIATWWETAEWVNRSVRTRGDGLFLFNIVRFFPTFRLCAAKPLIECDYTKSQLRSPAAPLRILEEFVSLGIDLDCRQTPF